VCHESDSYHCLLIAQVRGIIIDMVKSYILIKLLPGFESSALTQVRATPGVIEVNPLFGHWDAIAVAEGKSLHELSRLIINQIRGIQGVQDTETLVHGEI